MWSSYLLCNKYNVSASQVSSRCACKNKIMWIKIIYILLSLQICLAFDLPHKCLSDLKINNDHYSVSEVYKVGGGNVYPTDAHYDVYGNLFYVETTCNKDSYLFNINVVKFKTTVPQKIPGLPEGLSYSIAIDKRLTKVYFGTSNGIYLYSYETRSATPISNKTMKLDMIYVDNNSNKYIMEHLNGIEEFYLLDGDKKIRCNSLEALHEMAIDDKNNFYFLREDKLYILKSSQSTPQCIGDVTYQGMAQITFHDNNVFVASDRLAYFHENDTANLKVIDNIPGNVTAIAFDNSGDFILGVKGKIVKYRKNDCYLRKNRFIDEYKHY